MVQIPSWYKGQKPKPKDSSSQISATSREAENFATILINIWTYCDQTIVHASRALHQLVLMFHLTFEQRAMLSSLYTVAASMGFSTQVVLYAIEKWSSEGSQSAYQLIMPEEQESCGCLMNNRSSPEIASLRKRTHEWFPFWTVFLPSLLTNAWLWGHNGTRMWFKKWTMWLKISFY